MQDFSYRGKYVEFWQVTGKVLASDKYHETHISGRGGGGYIGQYGGRINPITIDSSTVINHEFWIKTEYGVEKDIKLRNINIPLRPGQIITLISAARKDADTGLYSILVNHRWHDWLGFIFSYKCYNNNTGNSQCFCNLSTYCKTT